MHRRFIAVAIAALAAILGLGMASASAAPAATPSNYYLALGDSLAAGYQPGQGTDPSGGYVGKVLIKERKTLGATSLTNLGCPGETTSTLINGGICNYTSGNQLDDAVAFLNAHAGHVGLITIDIGANDVAPCASPSGIDFACVQQGINHLQQNLPTIFGALRDAAPNTEIIVHNYYDPFLVFWLQGDRNGRSIAHASVSLLGSINNIIAQAAAGAQFKVADVATNFQSKNFKPVSTPLGTIPTNVWNICQWTYMCSQGDIHTNDTGYQVIAKTIIPQVTGQGPATKQ
jgi:lysophospholipase L1-like esterase